MVNLVALVANYLRSEGLAIYAELPDAVARPVTRVEEAGGGPQGSSLTPGRITRGDLQLTTWGTTKAEAWTDIATASDTLRDAPRLAAVQSEGTFVFVQALSPIYLPDEDWPVNGRPGPRYEMTVRIAAHG